MLTNWAATEIIPIWTLSTQGEERKRWGKSHGVRGVPQYRGGRKSRSFGGAFREEENMDFEEGQG